MAEHKFKVGDQVPLKSGGPAMTVAERPSMPGGEYYCRWFEGADVKAHNFHEEMLEPYRARARMVGGDD